MQACMGLHLQVRPVWRPFAPAGGPPRRSIISARPARIVNVRSSLEPRPAEKHSPEQAVLSAFLAFSAAVGLPYQADAKQLPTPAVPTEYDRLQEIVAGRAGAAGSLLDSFQSRAQIAAVGAQKLPEAPKVVGKTEKEPASAPASGGGGGGGISLPDASSVVQQAGAPSPVLLGGAGALVAGLGAFAFLGNKSGDPAKGAKKAVKRAAPKPQAGTKRIGAAAGKAVKQAPGPIKKAVGGAQKQAKQPAKAAGGLFGGAKKEAKRPAKAAGGLFGGAKKEAKKPAKAAGGLFGGAQKQAKQVQKTAKKVAPKATKKIRPGSQKIGTKKVGAAARKGGSSLRSQISEDALTTAAAVGVVGLGVLVGGFLILNVVTGVEVSDLAPASLQSAEKKLPAVPTPLPFKPIGRGSPPPERIKPAPQEGPVPPATIQPGPPKVPEGPELRPAPDARPKSGMPLAPPPSEGARPQAPSGPDLLIQPGRSPPAASVGFEAVEKAASGAIKQAEKATSAAPDVAQKAKDAAPTPSLADKAKQAASQAVPAVAEKEEEAANKAPQVAQKAAEAVNAPPAESLADKAKQAASQAVPSAARSEEAAANKQPQIAQKAAEVADAAPAPKEIPQAAQKAADAAPQAAQKAADAVPQAAQAAKTAVDTSSDVAQSVAEATGSNKAAVSDPFKTINVPKPQAVIPDKAQDAVPDLPDLQAPAAFEEARKKLNKNKEFPSAAEQFKAALAEPKTDKPKKDGIAAASKPAKIGGKEASKAASSGPNSNLLIFGGLVVAGAAAAALGSKGADGSINPAGDVKPPPTPTPSASAEKGSSNGSAGGGVKDDIQQRKSDAQAWIQDWRQRSK